MTKTKTITSSSGKTMRISTDERSVLNTIENQIIIDVLENAIALWKNSPFEFNRARIAPAKGIIEKLRRQES